MAAKTKAYYATGARSCVGVMTGPVEFDSIETAKRASMPAGATFAYIPLSSGFWVYTPRWHWEFRESTR